jgi:hypothetical protein
MTLANISRFAMTTVIAAACSVAADQSLDFEVYKTRVEPIFSKKREGHARRVVCHSEANNAFRLQPWGPRTKAFAEDFQMISKLVVPRKLERSLLLLHPLAKEGGGDEFHSAGRQFLTKNDPDWQTIAAWIRGAK